LLKISLSRTNATDRLVPTANALQSALILIHDKLEIGQQAKIITGLASALSAPDARRTRADRLRRLRTGGQKR